MNAAAPATAAAHTGSGTAAHAHTEPTPPPFNDPRFAKGSVGEFGQSATIKQEDGPGFLGMKAQKNQNNNDKEQNNFGETDANFSRTLGLIPETNTYAKTIQAYNMAGAIENLAPQTYAKLVANQNAGRGTVLGGALSIFGIKNPADASLAGVSQSEISGIANAQLPGLGGLKEYVLNLEDVKGREWNRAHHSGSSWKGMTDLVNKGFSWQEAALFTGDSMTSWSGRVLGSNNQDGSQSGFAADELAGLKYLVISEQATGKDILTSVLGAHADTHLPENKLTNPKINKLIGLPDNFRPKTPDEITMVAQRIRQWALQPGVEVKRNEFDKFLKATPGALGAKINASGLLNNVRFKAEEQNNNTNNNNAPEAEVPGVAQELGTGTLPEAAADTATELGTGTPLEAPANDTANPAAEGANLLGGGPTDIGVADASAGAEGVGTPQQVLAELSSEVTAHGSALSPAEQALLWSTIADIVSATQNSILSDADKKDKEKAAAADQARKGAKLASTTLKAALADGKIDASEKAALEGLLSPDAKAKLDAAMKDGKIDESELTSLKDDAAKAAEPKAVELPDDVKSALADGKLSDEERTAIEGKLTAEQKTQLDAALKDGKVDATELESLTKPEPAIDPKTDTKTDEKPDAKTDPQTGKPVVDAKLDPKTGTPVEDAKADATGDAKQDPTGKPLADAKPADKPEDKPAADAKPENKPAAAPASEAPPAPPVTPAAEPVAA